MPHASTAGDAVAAHYHRDDLLGSLNRALAARGRAPNGFTVEDLAPFDQFHLRGLPATLELLELAQVKKGDCVLDLGGGLGGAARTLASRLACHVTVVDLTPAYCEAGEELTRWLGLEDRVHFLVGDATAPPVPDAGFDVVWTQHASMNIPDKLALYHAAARALKPGGRFVLHDVVGDDDVDGLHFPVPWARHPELSALLHADVQRALIRAAGFTERAWRDVTEETLASLEERAALAAEATGGAGSFVGSAGRVEMENVRRNLAEGRLRVVQAVFD